MLLKKPGALCIPDVWQTQWFRLFVKFLKNGGQVAHVKFPFPVDDESIMPSIRQILFIDFERVYVVEIIGHGLERDAHENLHRRNL